MSTFDVDFEEEVLAQCLRDVEYLKSSTRLISAHHFSNPQLSWVWKVIESTWKSFAERPSPKIFKVRAERDFSGEDERRVVFELVVRLFRSSPKSPRASLDELQRFVRTCYDLQL